MSSTTASSTSGGGHLRTTEIFAALRFRKRSKAAKQDAARKHRIPDACVVAQIDKPDEFAFTNLEQMPAHPCVVMVNKKSGGNKGLRLMQACLEVLHPVQVVDLIAHGPSKALALFGSLNRPFRVIAAGGDGSIAWVLESIEKAGLGERVDVGLVPMGTGNDLARVLGWGPGYDGTNIGKFIDMAAAASTIDFDRWVADVTLATGENKRFYINNYFSVGVSAAVALRFDQGRRENPGLYKSRTVNKAIYAMDGLLDSISRPCKNLHEKLEVECDGKKLTLPELEDVVILNIPSYAGGTNFWQLSGPMRGQAQTFQDASFTDGKLEMLSVRSSFHMGQIKIGLGQAVRLAQPSHIVITSTTQTELPLQVDGEPSKLAFTRIEIRHHNTLRLLTASEDDQKVLAREAEKAAKLQAAEGDGPNALPYGASSSNKTRASAEALFVGSRDKELPQPEASPAEASMQKVDRPDGKADANGAAAPAQHHASDASDADDDDNDGDGDN